MSTLAGAATSPPVRPAQSAWERYRPWRRGVEVGFWVAMALVNAVGNTLTVFMEFSRIDLAFDGWEPVLWEVSSNLVVLALLPALVAFTRRFPLRLDTWRRMVPLYLLASLAWSATHVAGMVALRKAVYALLGDGYEFSPWWWEFAYEYLKDIRGFALIVLIIEGYRLLVRRLQGEASVPATSEDDAPPPHGAASAERFLVRKLGREFLLRPDEVESLHASGNYINLHVRGREYPMRATMAGIEARLDPARFVRIHRGHIVNIESIDRIEPLPGGEARVVLRDGRVLPCSRRYRSALRQGGSPRS